MVILYAVFVPSEDPEKRQGFVFCSLEEAKQCAKEHQKTGARFKVFASETEARLFASQGDCSASASGRSDSPSKGVDGSPDSDPAFPRPSPTELALIRSDIEIGRTAEFRCKVIQNPRLLVNHDVDTPTILNVGCRLNAMHVAARYGNWVACKVILSFFEDTVLLRFLNPKRSSEVLEQARKFLFDLYLNMPEKMINATPLYLACKYGHIGVVRLLVSYKECVRESASVDGKTPMDVICESAKHVDARVKEEIRRWLDRTSCYVPLYRDGNARNVGAAVLRRPCMDIPPMYLNEENMVTGGFLAAFAGPMKQEQAYALHQEWSTKKVKCVESSQNALRYMDPQKGMERIGRALALKYECTWTEYWQFLDAYCDLRTEEGLAVFNQYLALRDLPGHRLGFALDPNELRPTSEMCEQNGVDGSNNVEDEVYFDALAELPYDDENDNYDDQVRRDEPVRLIERFYSAQESLQPSFIYGPEATKTDYDVFEAINEVPLLAIRHRHVRQWYRDVCSFPKEVMTAWPPYDSPRARAMRKSVKNAANSRRLF